MSKKYKLKRLLVRRYQILAAILFILAAGLVLLPKYKKNEGVKPDLFVKNIISSERYINTDLLADRSVNQDPTVLLIDISLWRCYLPVSSPWFCSRLFS